MPRHCVWDRTRLESSVISHARRRRLWTQGDCQWTRNRLRCAVSSLLVTKCDSVTSSEVWIACATRWRPARRPTVPALPARRVSNVAVTLCTVIWHKSSQLR